MSVPDDYAREIAATWGLLQRRVDTKWHGDILAAAGLRDARLVPQGIWWRVILPHFNDMRHRRTYNNKSMMASLLHLPNGRNSPQRVLHRVRGEYYGAEWESLDRAMLPARLRGGDYIVKGADTNNGKRIGILVPQGDGFSLDGRTASWEEVEHRYGNDFLVEDRVVQHEEIARFHPNSLNTLRMLTFSWRGRIHHLMSFMRFGRHGMVNDNAGTGGLCVGVDGDGCLLDLAIDKSRAHYDAHPDTGARFGGFRVPAWDDALALVQFRHRLLPHFGLVSWDVGIDRSGAPVIIEVNFRGVLSVYQLACRKPAFGDLTEDMIADVASRPPATPPKWQKDQQAAKRRRRQYTRLQPASPLRRMWRRMWRRLQRS